MGISPDSQKSHQKFKAKYGKDPDSFNVGAYDTMIATLKAERGAAFDRDYVNGQIDYQKGNAALFRQEIENGSDPDLKQFAIHTLPKIEDHLQRILKLAGASGHSASN